MNQVMIQYNALNANIHHDHNTVYMFSSTSQIYINCSKNVLVNMCYVVFANMLIFVCEISL